MSIGVNPKYCGTAIVYRHRLSGIRYGLSKTGIPSVYLHWIWYTHLGWPKAGSSGSGFFTNVLNRVHMCWDPSDCNMEPSSHGRALKEISYG